jgi:hypothetical protein
VFLQLLRSNFYNKNNKGDNMKNKLVLLLAATLGLAHGSMKASEGDAPGDSAPGQSLLGAGTEGGAGDGGSFRTGPGGVLWGRLAPQRLVPAVVSGEVTGPLANGLVVPGFYINDVFVPKEALEAFVQQINSTDAVKDGRATPKTLDGLITDLADPTIDAFPSVQKYLLEQGISIPDRAEELEVETPTPNKLSAFKGLMTNSWETARNKAKRDWKSFADGYVANWNDSDISKKRKTARLGTRAARDVIHAANAANFIAELAGDRNMVLDGLNVNKKLAQDKNFAWLRSGKSKSARALRVLISFAQAGLLGSLNHFALGKLVKMADAGPSAEEGQEKQEDSRKPSSAI